MQKCRLILIDILTIWYVIMLLCICENGMESDFIQNVEVIFACDKGFHGHSLFSISALILGSMTVSVSISKTTDPL